MPKLAFFRQERADRGVRTGIALNGEDVFQHFEDGEEVPDPALLWFVDLRCEGASLPKDPDAAWQWLLDHTKTIRSGLLKCADERKSGVDADIYPLLWKAFPKAPAGVTMTIAFSATR
jgi:hypothetical protein